MLHIFISCDENYAPHLATTIMSILDNCQKPEALSFIIGDGGLSSDTISRLHAMIAPYQSQITFTYLHESKFEGLEVKRYGLSIYFRLYLSEVIDPSIQHIVCIDCDTIVVDDITTIMDDLPTQDFTLAAVENIGRSPYKSLGLEKGKYFNCGLMLINMPRWKEYNIGERALYFLRKHPELCLYPEQSAPRIKFSTANGHNYRWSGMLNVLLTRFLRKEWMNSIERNMNSWSPSRNPR